MPRIKAAVQFDSTSDGCDFRLGASAGTLAGFRSAGLAASLATRLGCSTVSGHVSGDLRGDAREDDERHSMSTDQRAADRGAAQRVAEYLGLVARVEARHAAGHDSDSRLRRLAKHAVPESRRGTARVVVTDAVALRERRKVPALLERDPLLLHLGSGTQYKDGWVNVDLAGDPVDLAWNLARPLPLPAGCAAGVFSEHVLEHLPFEAGLGLLREAHRVLRPGGIVRIVVPDGGKLLRSYVDGGRGFIEETRGGRPTRDDGGQRALLLVPALLAVRHGDPDAGPRGRRVRRGAGAGVRRFRPARR